MLIARRHDQSPAKNVDRDRKREVGLCLPVLRSRESAFLVTYPVRLPTTGLLDPARDTDMMDDSRKKDRM